MKRYSIVSGFVAASLIGALGLAPLASAQLTERTEVTEKTTTYSGTLTEIEPSSSTIVVRKETSAAPVRYTYTKNTTFVDADGRVVSQELIKNSPVTLYYTKEGDSMIVTKVVTRQPAAVLEKRTIREEHTID